MEHANVEDARSPDASIIIIGTGFSGLGMAIKLKQSGRDDFLILEKQQEVGGCWRDNTYPGCCCDIPSHLYSFSFESKSDWSKKYPLQNEIYEYIKSCASKYDLYRHIQFGQEVKEIRFCDETSLWHVHLKDGSQRIARFVIAGKGPLHVPSLPNIPGIDQFAGESFHSSQWRHDIDLTGKRVAVVGTGASAIQFIPQIASKVKSLHVFQRSPGWIVPRPDRYYRGIEKALFKWLPFWQKLYRQSIFYNHEMRVSLLDEKSFYHKQAEKMALKHLESTIEDPEVRKQLTPDYALGCKRLLISNDYYPTFNRSNVSLINSGVKEIKPQSLVASDGRDVEVDVIIWGTGFEAADPLDKGFLFGPGGKDLFERWDTEGAQAHKGVSVAGLPNFFFMVGPNSGLGHNSMILMIEAQIKYVLQCLDYVEQHDVKLFDVRRDVQDQYNEQLQENTHGRVWESGCQSWYLNKHGQNTTVWPGYVMGYQQQMRKLKPHEYLIE